MHPAFKISRRRPGRRSFARNSLRSAAATLLVLLAGCGGGGDAPGEAPSVVVAPPAEGIAGKVIAGYQGWFGCPGDFQGNPNWQHWFLGPVAAAHLTVDLLPTHEGIDDADLCNTGLLRADATKQKLFSSTNANVVATHFRWMRDHDIDGVALQRFTDGLADPARKARKDRVLANVRAAADATGRVFYISWDVSGDGPTSADVVAHIRADWKYLIDELHVTDSPQYLRDGGKPVVELWGFGFSSRPGDPGDVAALIADLKSGNDGLEAAFVIGGVPGRWRTLSGSSKTDAQWASVYRSYDVISPWLVGRFGDEASADQFLHDVVLGDFAETQRLGIGYLPVTFPGYSSSNQQLNKGQPGAIFNEVPRRCGDFLWHQYVNLLGAGAKGIYAAMFDEFDEGTALAPAETSILDIPLGASIVVLDQEGCSVPDDWYLRITGKAADYLRSGSAPPAQLDQAM